MTADTHNDHARRARREPVGARACGATRQRPRAVTASNGHAPRPAAPASDFTAGNGGRLVLPTDCQSAAYAYGNGKGPASRAFARSG
jgi:hypothetical protein